MLLLGAVFALLISGFWHYCLVDVALTPRNECRGLPKAAWVVIVAGTFVAGAVAWLAARSPARPALPSTAAGRPPGPGQAGTSQPGTRPAAHHDAARGPESPVAPAPDAPAPDAPALDAPALDGPALDGPALDGPNPDGPALDGPNPDGADSDGSGPTLPPEGHDRPSPRYGRPDPTDWDGPVHGGWDGPDPSANLEAEAALLRHPAARARPRSASSRSQPKGPDDDPEFLRRLNRAIHGLEAEE